MPALYPAASAPEDFLVGDRVRKFVTEWNVTPYLGIVTQVVPSTYKVWVQWPIGNAQAEDPQTLIRVNPVYGLPTVHKDMGYDSYGKSVSEKLHGAIPKTIRASNKMAIRIASTFATKVIGRLVKDIVGCYEGGLNDIGTYNKIYKKYSSICSDYIIRSSVQRVYSDLSVKVKDYVCT